METTLKIKSISQPDPRGAYPSERRYSASMVMGLSIVHLVLSLISLVLMALAFVTESRYIFAPAICALGCTTAGVAGILASRRWYIDHHISGFFYMSLISTLTSVVAITCSVNMLFPWTLDHFHANIFFCCLACIVWSVISVVVAYKGMKNTYPDDIIVSKCKGKVEVCTKQKGNKNAKIVMDQSHPDILNHYKKTGGNLPKTESYSEYLERVHKYLDDKQ